MARSFELILAFALLATFMVVEAVAARATGSLARLTDAGRMFTDVLGFAMAWPRSTPRAAPTATRNEPFDIYRLEVLSASSA